MPFYYLIVVVYLFIFTFGFCNWYFLRRWTAFMRSNNRYSYALTGSFNFRWWWWEMDCPIFMDDRVWTTSWYVYVLGWFNFKLVSLISQVFQCSPGLWSENLYNSLAKWKGKFVHWIERGKERNGLVIIIVQLFSELG